LEKQWLATDMVDRVTAARCLASAAFQ